MSRSGSDLSQSLLISGSINEFGSFDIEDKSIENGNDDNAPIALRHRSSNNCSNNLIMRKLKKPRPRGALIYALNIIAVLIILGKKYMDVSNYYSQQPEGEGTNSMIATAALSETVIYWIVFCSWSIALHELVKYFQKPDLTNAELYLLLAADLKTIKSHITNDDAEGPRLTFSKQLSIMHQSVSNIESKIGDGLAYDLPTVSSSYDRKLKTTLVAVENLLSGAYRNISPTVDLGPLIKSIEDSYIKEIHEEKSSTVSKIHPNNYDIAYMISQILILYSDSANSVISVENCEKAMTILISISKEINSEGKDHLPGIVAIKNKLKAATLTPNLENKTIDDSEQLVKFVADKPYETSLRARP